MRVEEIKQEDADKYFGYVYKITNTVTDEYYIGKKQFQYLRTVKLTVKKQKELNTRKKSIKVVKESDWRDYYGSSSSLTNDIEKYGKECFIREVLVLCLTKRELTYNEVKQQFKYEVLEDSKSYNQNILGKFWKQPNQECLNETSETK